MQMLMLYAIISFNANTQPEEPNISLSLLGQILWQMQNSFLKLFLCTPTETLVSNV